MKVEFLTPAQREFEQIVRYYDQQREGLGNQIIIEFRRTVRRIENFPTAWSAMSSDVPDVKFTAFLTVSSTRFVMRGYLSLQFNITIGIRITGAIG